MRPACCGFRLWGPEAIDKPSLRRRASCRRRFDHESTCLRMVLSAHTTEQKRRLDASARGAFRDTRRPVPEAVYHDRCHAAIGEAVEGQPRLI